MRVKRKVHSSPETCPGCSQQFLDETLNGVTDFAKTGQESHFNILDDPVWPRETQGR